MKREKWIRVLAVLCAVSVFGMICALRFSTTTDSFSPPPFDPAAQSGVPSVPEGLGYTELEAGDFRAALCGNVTAEKEAAVIFLTNPGENHVWLKLRLLDENRNILGETGLVRPGEFVRLLEMNPMPEPGTPVVLKVMAYEPDTYHSQGAVTVNTRMGD